MPESDNTRDVSLLGLLARLGEAQVEPQRIDELQQLYRRWWDSHRTDNGRLEASARSALRFYVDSLAHLPQPLPEGVVREYQEKW